MASRRRASGLKLIGKQIVDEGTPETRARLQPPPWAGWPQELQDAAAAIRDALMLQAAGSAAKAQDYARMSYATPGENPALEAWQATLERRYHWWRWEVARTRGWSVAVVLSCVAEHGPAPDYLAEALRVYATAPRSVWG